MKHYAVNEIFFSADKNENFIVLVSLKNLCAEIPANLLRRSV